MSRYEENEKIIENIKMQAKEMASWSYEEISSIQQGAIATMLMEISKSLAVIADNLERRNP